MEKLNRSLDEVVDCIKESKEYKKCIELKEKMKDNEEVNSLVKEIIITVFATFQFYLIIILLNQIFTDKNNERFLW